MDDCRAAWTTAGPRGRLDVRVDSLSALSWPVNLLGHLGLGAMVAAVLEAASRFPTTRWTLILKAQGTPELRRQAFAELAQSYWRPLFVFLRSKGLEVAAAQDATQELLLSLMERDVVGKVTPERGRLRGYLRTAAQNHLASLHEKSVAQKRGSGSVVVPIDQKLAETLPSDAAAPEFAFEREWALLVMQRAMDRLKAEFENGVRGGPFALVEQFFGPGAGRAPSYAAAAQAHGMSLPQLKAFLHRARIRFRELVREQVLDTVETEAEVESELAALVEVLSR